MRRAIIIWIIIAAWLCCQKRRISCLVDALDNACTIYQDMLNKGFPSWKLNGITEGILVMTAMNSWSLQHLSHGGLLTEEWVVTTAHALQWLPDLIYPKIIIVGFDQMGDITEYRRASELWIHPEFHPEVSARDIALIKVERPFSYARFLNSAKLSLFKEVFELKDDWESLQCFTIGNLVGKSPMCNLEKFDLRFISKVSCKHMFYQDRLAFRRFYTDPLTCGFIDGVKNCRGSPGMPVFCKEFTEPTLVGFLVLGVDCDRFEDFGGMFLPIRSYLSWIMMVMTKSEYKMQQMGDTFNASQFVPWHESDCPYYLAEEFAVVSDQI